MHRFLLFALVFGLPPVRADAANKPVAITQAQPIEKLDSDGHPSAVTAGTVGATYTLVKQDGDQVILRDASGTEYEIAIAATDYTPPPAAPSAPPAAAPASPPATNTATASTTTNAAPSAASTAVTSDSPPPWAMKPPGPATTPSPLTSTSTAAGPALSKDDADKLDKLNDALGIPLLTGTPLWKEKVDDVASRLNWPQESKTDTEESFRRYANAGEALVFGTSAYSLALYGKNGKPTYFSLVFANEGDFAEVKQVHDSRDGSAIDAALGHLADAVKSDGKTITDALSAILGEPTLAMFGNSSSNRDEMHRWDWNGAAFLLNTHQGQFCSLKIVPSGVADNFGTVDVTDRDELRDLLAKRVVKRDNGDVIVSELPMVDQGPKGYCVPATWERYLRYMDLPADLYVLAMVGHSGLGGGTDTSTMNVGIDDYVTAYHRRLELYGDPVDAEHVARYIDQGLPLAWACFVSQPVEDLTNAETADRKSVTDWADYKNKLDVKDRALGDTFLAHHPGEENGHMRLIIGYNKQTNEIAISDSWGEQMAERWVYSPTAQRITQNAVYYLSW